MPCPECGAATGADAAGCAERFARLLALDHARQEPWGSRHGVAFAAYTLQHPANQPIAVLGGCWYLLHRVYVQQLDRAFVVKSLRARDGAPAEALPLPPLTRPDGTRPTFAVTIADLGAFDAATYAAGLDAWARATLVAYGAVLPPA
ncbi:MAG: hypothetical protein HY275_12890 [Gemmatimonadetes bacterium]|nr:hypothetical protein [Gemmatimonadota bacterium]